MKANCPGWYDRVEVDDNSVDYSVIKYTVGHISSNTFLQTKKRVEGRERKPQLLGKSSSASEIIKSGG